MKIKETRQKTDIELYKLLKEQKKKLQELNFELTSKQIKNVREIRKTKKTIARILTIIKERELKKQKGLS